MAIWPFNRRRRRTSSPHDEKARANQSAAAAQPAILSRRSSRNGSQRRRRASQQPMPVAQPWVDLEKRPNSDKENVPFRYGSSREDITALPGNRKLDQSPHLRAIDHERARIPYNFRPYSLSQTSLQRQEATGKLQRPATLRSKRSTNDYSTPTRQMSSRRSKKRDERLREEEIRMMSSPIPIPRRTGDGPLRRDSKRYRGAAGLRDSNVSLPPDGSVHSSMSGPMDQRGWEVGSFAVFNPRPAVRLSGTPQNVVSSSLPTKGPGLLYHIESRNGKDAKEKSRLNRDTKRRLPTVGDEADDLDSSDIRALMEREAKRRVRRDQEKLEKLDRKLKNRTGRERGDSDRKRRDAAEEKRIEEARLRAAEQLQSRGPVSPPIAVHPALRVAAVESTANESIGLGIAKAGTTATYVPTENEAVPENPFVDAMEELPPPLHAEELQAEARPSTSTPLETPFEDPVLETAHAVRMSQAFTPPLSPVYHRGSATHSSSQLTEAIRQQSISHQSMSHHSMQSVSDLPRPPPIDFNERRSSDPPGMPKDRRTGTWAAIFRRGGTFRRGGADEAASPSEFSFSNTSRESMRNQPIPAHLIDPNAHRPHQVRRISGTPVRTMSKFREDLPDDLPISPPDSRTQSPDVLPAAAMIAAARRDKPQPIDIRGRPVHHDASASPHRQPPHSASMASVGSEGSWLANGSVKRKSHQSSVTRPFSRRNAEFSASYEDLGGSDKDAEYFTNNAGRRVRTSSNPATIDASQGEESDEEGNTTLTTPGEAPLTVHGSVRRKPTLVQRDSRLKSREGLVTEYAGNIEAVEVRPDESPDRDSDVDGEDYEPAELERARSVNYGSVRHSRQFSAGSARLLDVSRSSMDLSRQRTPTPTQLSSPRAEQRQGSV